MRGRIIAEDLKWTLVTVPSLSNHCLESIANNFEALAEQALFEVITPTQKALIEEKLSPSLPLHLTVPLISDGVYWKQCYKQRWDLCDVSDFDHSWKRMFLERHMENMIELFIPNVTEPNTILEMVPFCKNYIKRLNISQLLLPVKEPKKEDEEHGSNLELQKEDDGPHLDHFDFSILLDKLTNLEELHLVYGIKQCGLNFEWKMFEMTDQDCESLAKALKSCQTLKLFSLRQSRVEDTKCRLLVKYLLDHPSLRKLDFSYNRIGDSGARAIGKLLTMSKLETLNMSDNNISSSGAKAIAHALTENSTLLSLNLRLNNMGDEGGQAIGQALLDNNTLLHLHLGGTGVTWPTALALSTVLVQNNTLKSINLSCNKLGEVGGKALVEAMSENTTVTECDLRLTEVDEPSLTLINKKVNANQMSEQKEELKRRMP